MSETFECPKCGYQWPKGAHGGHSCSDLLLKKLEAVNAECLELVQTLKAILHLRPPYIKANKLVAHTEQSLLQKACPHQSRLLTRSPFTSTCNPWMQSGC